MDQQSLYLIAADTLLAFHVLVVLFIVFGLLLTLAGKLRDWRWVTNPWFRVTHLIAVAIVILQAWLGELCPLTTWEMALRDKAGDAVYAGSFIAHWLNRLLYYDAPLWLFTVAYTLFGILVLLAWFWVRPRSFRR